MRRVIVSGITGHLGRELALQLVAANYAVHGLTRQSVTSLASWPKEIQLHRLDGSTERLVSILTEVRPQMVFHLAALARREHVSADVVPFIEANVLFGAQLLEAMRSADCERMVLAGSYLQHFDTNGYRPFNLYAATKQAFEDLLAYYVDAVGFTAIGLTLGDIYSEHDARTKLMTDIAKAARTGTALTLHAPEAWIDPIHVNDAVAAFLKAASLLDSGAAARGSLAHYSVTYGRDVSTTELIRLFEKLGERKLEIERGRSSPRRQIKPWRGTLLPGWAPTVTLEEGIERMLARGA